MAFYAMPGIFGPWIRDITLRQITSWYQPGFETPETVAEYMISQGVKDKIMHLQLNMMLDSKVAFAFLLFLGVVPPIFGIVESLSVVWSKSKHTTAHILEGLLPAFLIVAYYLIIFMYSDLLWTHPTLT